MGLQIGQIKEQYFSFKCSELVFFVRIRVVCKVRHDVLVLLFHRVTVIGSEALLLNFFYFFELFELLFLAFFDALLL